MMCLMVWYFCDDVIISGFAHLVGGISSYIWLFGFACLLAISLIISNKNKLWVPILLYVGIVMLVLFTEVFHPENSSWLNHEYYNIQNMLVHPRGAIWAFIVMWLVDDSDDMYNSLRIIAYILLAYYVIQFLQAMRVGYWTSYDIDGTLRQTQYNLEFGYSMLLPTAFFGASAFLDKKRIHYFIYAGCILIILLGGSRGAAVWGILLFPIMLPFKWKNLNKKERNRWIIACFFLIPFALIIYNYLYMLQMGLTYYLSSKGISSRTLDAILSGTLSDANARDDIYEKAIELIKTGGPFGRGIYGDRPYIGRFYKWGYSHNVFLELLVTFGYVGGSFVCGWIVYGVFKLFRNLVKIEEQIVFITFFISSLKLMLSNSFWYVPAFWVVLVLMVKWKRNVMLNDTIIDRGL